MTQLNVWVTEIHKKIIIIIVLRKETCNMVSDVCCSNVLSCLMEKNGTGWDGREGRWGLKIRTVAQGDEMVTNG